MKYNVITGPWTAERVEALRTMWTDGLSCSEISKALDCGLSRCAVIGKVHRLSLPIRDKTTAQANISRGMRTKHARKIAAVIPAPPSLAPAPLGPIGEFLSTGCKFIAADRLIPDGQMCGHPTVPGRSWCAFHFSLCFDKARTATASEAFKAKSDAGQTRMMRRMGLG
jgi:GcrA cell cycle regulator